ncbi:MAG: THUMP domain-containing protein [Acidobacteriota bacterium]
MQILVTVAKGLEGVVREELRSLGLKPEEAGPGVVGFGGSMADAYRANLWLRAARRVLLPLGSFEVKSGEDLYAGALALPWHRALSAGRTFAVEASVRDSAITHSGYAALKVKDAVADALRERLGSRPDVDRRNPDVQVVVHLAGGTCTVSLDSSGGPLHKRGYRERSVAAPLNETLAAGMLLLMGYDGSAPFADPFCGSGTICVEAALIATRTAPGLLRKRPFGFQRWAGFEERIWKRQVEEARSSVRPAPSPIAGGDDDASAIRAAQANAEAAGVSRCVQFRRADLSGFRPPAGPGLLITNPPYGDHAGAGEDLAPLYQSLGDVLKQRFAGWRAAVLTGNTALAKRVGLHPSRRIPLFNGPMECRLLVFELYEGSRKDGNRETGRQEDRETEKI